MQIFKSAETSPEDFKDLSCILTNEGGFSSEQKHAARTLTVGKRYQVTSIDMRSSFTYLGLKGEPGTWNSALFDIPHDLLVRICLPDKAPASESNDSTAKEEPPITLHHCCPWCNSPLQVNNEPMPKLCEDDPDRQWFLECRHCGAEGPRCRTQLDALKLLPEPEQTAERLRLFP